MSNTDSWTKENDKIKLVIAQYCTYQERVQFCYFKKKFVKVWQKHDIPAKNMLKTWKHSREKKHEKQQKCQVACLLILNFRYQKKRIHIKTIFIKISAISKLSTNMKIVY